jgi:hypothetical protein
LDGLKSTKFGRRDEKCEEDKSILVLLT